jgi:hypothetical protein
MDEWKSNSLLDLGDHNRKRIKLSLEFGKAKGVKSSLENGHVIKPMTPTLSSISARILI